MLIIRRKVGERIVLASEVSVTVASATQRAVRLAVEAPAGVAILRGEVFDAIVAANVKASRVQLDALIERWRTQEVTHDPD